MTRFVWMGSFVLALFLGLVALGCSGGGQQNAEMDDQDAMGMEDGDLPEPPAPAARSGSGSGASQGTATRQVPEDRKKSVTPAPPSTVTLTVPEGTNLSIAIDGEVTSATAAVGDPVGATLRQPVVVGSRVVFPADSRLRGRVTDVKPASKGFKDTGGAVAVSFDRITSPSGNSATIVAGFTKVATGSGGKKAAIIGGSAAGGALLGKVLGKDTKGSAVVGGAIGTAVAGGTKGKEAILEPGEQIDIGLEQAVRVTLAR